jgi:predicted metal-binding membrane protein
MIVRRDLWKPSEENPVILARAHAVGGLQGPMRSGVARSRWARALVRVRWFRWRHPEWWVLVAAAAAWVWMIGMPAGHAGHGAAHAAHGDAPAGPSVLWIAVMVVAMMAPLTVSGVRHVAVASAWRGRRVAVAEFMAGYVAVWLAASVLIALAWGGLAAAVPWAAAVALVVAAAVLWELAPARRRQLVRCERTVPLARRGWRADRDRLRFGAERGVSCVATCWALMAACTAFAHSVPVMAILFAVRIVPRHPRHPSPALAAAGVCVAALVGWMG